MSNPHPDTRSPGHLHALTGLRAVAAFWVLGYHLRYYLPHGSVGEAAWRVLFGGGFLGVDLFFVLSGFVLAYNYQGLDLHRRPADLLVYLRKRLVRIYPAHLATLMLLLALVLVRTELALPLADASRYGADSLLTNLLLVNAWSVPVVLTWNINAWSVSAEWAAYLALPWCLFLTGRLHATLRLVLLPGLWIGLAACVAWAAFPDAKAHGMARLVAGFASGLLIAELHRDPGGLSRWPWSVLAGGTAVVLWLASGALIDSELHRLMWFGPLSILVVLGLVRAPDCALATWLASPALTYWGERSYALFLVHRVVIVYLQNLSPVPMDAAGRLSWMALALLGSLLAAVALHAWVEVPMRNWLRRPLRRPRAA